MDKEILRSSLYQYVHTLMDEVEVTQKLINLLDQEAEERLVISSAQEYLIQELEKTGELSEATQEVVIKETV